jgi:folate-binding protein YgfZ
MAMGEPGTPDLRSSPGAVALARDVVVVEGPDAVSFLQGQLSQDIEALTLGVSAPSFLLQPTGKVDAWLRVTRSADDAVLLDVDPGWGDAVAARLKRFLLRTKATLVQGSWAGVALRGPDAASIPTDGGYRLAVRWPGVEGVDVLGPEGVALGVALTDDAALEALRIEAGVPAMGAEVTEATIPAELGQWLVDTSVSFTKGCYTGQELVARIDSRGGKVPRPIRGLRVDGPVPDRGTAVLVEGAEVGRITSAAASSALGSVALAALARGVEPGTVVTLAGHGSGDDGSATVAELPLR